MPPPGTNFSARAKACPHLHNLQLGEKISRKKGKAKEKEKEKAREKERAVTVKTVRIVEFPVIQRTFAGNRRNQK